MASEILRQLRDRYRNMKSGGGVLCIAALQLAVGLILLGIYEGYKVVSGLTYPAKQAAMSICPSQLLTWQSNHCRQDFSMISTQPRQVALQL